MDIWSPYSVMFEGHWGSLFSHDLLEDGTSFEGFGGPEGSVIYQ